MPRKAPNCRLNLSIADKRKVLKIYEERAVGVGQRKVAKMASEQLGRPISHVTVHIILIFIIQFSLKFHNSFQKVILKCETVIK